SLIGAGGVLIPGDRYQVVFTVNVDPNAAGAPASLDNTATAGGLAPGAVTPVTDLSDNGVDPTTNPGDPTGDPTPITPPATAGTIGLVKTSTLDLTGGVSATSLDAGDAIDYAYVVTNTGIVNLLNVTVAEPDSVANDFTGTGVVPTPAYDSGGSTIDGTGTLNDLAPSATVTWTSRYTITQDDIDAGGVTNSAVATGTDPAGNTPTDSSDESDPAAGNNDPTVTTLAAIPSLTLGKTLVSERTLFPTVYEATFQITALNDGNVTQTNIQLVDDLAAFAAPATVRSASISSVTGFTMASANPGYTGVGANDLLSGTPELAPGDTGVVTIVVTYSSSTGFPSPGTNTVTGSSDQTPTPTPATANSTFVDTDGDGSIDGNESPTGDRDGDGIPDAADYDPTGYFYCEEDGSILTGGLVTVTGGGFSQTGVGTSGPINIVADGSGGFYQFDVTAPGTYTLTYTDPTGGIASVARLPTVAPTDVTILVDVITGTATTDPRILGSSEFGATGALADNSLAANPAFYTTFVIEAGDPTIFSNNIPYQACSTPAPLSATKTVIGQTDVKVGDLVQYRIDYTLGATGGAIASASLVDLLPEGILYLPGSATISLNGAAAVPTEPVQAGRRLTWAGQPIPVSSTLSVTFSARVAANAPIGRLTNQAFAADAAGTLLSNIATAVIERVPEHVFDCSDVIGKVFDDLNHNGYQDQGEPGLPAVRVVTVKGTRITTDEHGRFHVPCAELPSDIGSNFIMKLDTRSLPTGYRVTTENPRVVRLTAGKFAKVNFGASISNVVRIDVNAKAFQNDTKIKPAFEQAIRNMVAQMRNKPSVVRLTYVFNDGATQKTARNRLTAVENLIKNEWRKEGQYKLNIERTIKRRAGE
ncbi:MAG: isopeptide-forming domain-containing fimbrial protein, partial [Sulfitobacter sp.]